MYAYCIYHLKVFSLMLSLGGQNCFNAKRAEKYFKSVRQCFGSASQSLRRTESHPNMQFLIHVSTAEVWLMNKTKTSGSLTGWCSATFTCCFLWSFALVQLFSLGESAVMLQCHDTRSHNIKVTFATERLRVWRAETVTKMQSLFVLYMFVTDTTAFKLIYFKRK